MDKTEPKANALDSSSLRARFQQLSGGYDYADTLHNVYLDFGYPNTLTFQNYWNMYRRLGIAKNVCDLYVDTAWITKPEITGSDQFNKEFEIVKKKNKFFQRIKGADKRQRVGRYAGLYMRVADGQDPSTPLDGKLPGTGALVDIIPLYESQLEVTTAETDPRSVRYGQPVIYQWRGGVEGDRNEEAQSSFNIHWTRVVPVAEDADDGTIYGVPALEAAYNSLMDVRKIVGGGAEGFYKNAAQNILFKLAEGSASEVSPELIKAFTEQYDEFAKNRFRRAMLSPGLEPETLNSTLVNPKDFFFNALYDIAAASKIPATILIGQQTGRLASSEDSRHFLSVAQSRREGFCTDGLIEPVIDWMMKFGILPASDYEVVWDDLLARSDEERLENSKVMSQINKEAFSSGQPAPFTSDEIREAAGFEVEDLDEPDESLDDDLVDE